VQKFPMTGPGLQRLADELRQLKVTERPSIIRQIAEARSHGDLSENAEYHAARERQSFIEGRIAELEEIVSSAEVIDPSGLSGEHVMFGAHVHLVDEETEKESTYQIVGVHEADIKGGRLSISSPRLFAGRSGLSFYHAVMREGVSDQRQLAVPPFDELLADLDLFDTYRWLVAIVCTVYATIVTWQWVVNYLQWFQSSRELKRVGGYAALLLLRIRVRRFALEMLQIVGLTALFFYIVHLHQVLARW